MRSELRAVLDTNVLESAVLQEKSVLGACLRRIVEAGTLLLSRDVLLEYANVLMRPKLDRFVDRSLRTEILLKLVAECEPVFIRRRFRVRRDPNDDKFLELAANGNAGFLVTGDADLASIGEFRGVPIVSPQVFLDRTED